MKKDKIAILIFAEGHNREDVYQNRLPIQEREIDKLVKNLNTVFDIDTENIPEIRSKREGITQAKIVNGADAVAVILYIPTFNNPATVAHTTRIINKPMALVGNWAKDSMSQLGFLASAGAVSQIGAEVKRVPFDGCTPEAVNTLRLWVNAVKTKTALEGETFGCIGGRSLGIATGTANAAQWEKLFGVDIEQIDQLELVTRANNIDKDVVDQTVAEIKKKYGKVIFSEENRFTENHLRKMVSSYLAMKSIVRDYELDFCGIKCQTELSNGYCLQCLTVQMLNDPYDMTGKKNPVVCSCEADADGALSMEILKHISGGKPTALQDIASIGENGFVLANCGAMASYFSRLSQNMDENLADVYLMPHGFGLAGGAATQFVVAEDIFTFMRLFRIDGEYYMGIFSGETEKRDREELKKYSPYRPTAFVRHKLDVSYFMETFCSNHLHCVQGNYVQDLIEFCKIMKIKYYVY